MLLTASTYSGADVPERKTSRNLQTIVVAVKWAQVREVKGRGPRRRNQAQRATDGLNRDGTLKHRYPDDQWVLVPLGHWNWKWNQARGNCSTYEQELLAGMLMLSSQSRLLGSNSVVWLCVQEPVRTFQKRLPPEKAKLRPWWTYLSQLRLSVHHIQGVKNECANYISRNTFDDMIGARSEELAKEAFSCMDVHLDLNMTMIRPLDGLQQVEYLKEFGDIYKRLEKRLEPALVSQEQWKRDKTYLWHGDRIAVPSNRIPALLQWTHESSGHVGANRTLKLLKQWFHSTWSDDQLRKALQPVVDKCLCTVLHTRGYQGQRSLFDPSHAPLCQQCSLPGLHGDA